MVHAVWSLLYFIQHKLCLLECTFSYKFLTVTFCQNWSFLCRNFLANLFNSSRDNLYFPSRNWTLEARKHLNNSLGEEGLKRQLLLSKPNSFLSHPLPECSCTVSKPVGNNECPKWLKDSFFNSRTQDSTTANENEQPNDETDEEEMGSDDEDGTSRFFYLDQDQEMDPND